LCNRPALGAESVGGHDDVMGLIERADVGRLPAPYMCCGTEDALLEDNLDFRDACARAKIPLSVDSGPGGHEWSYWDARIQDVLEWLPLSGDAG
jgi:putative tributyrin esterase